MKNNSQPDNNQMLLFDIESTGLLRQGSKIHCIVARDVNSKAEPIVFDYRETQTINMGVNQLLTAGCLIGHNIIGYDIPLIKETYDFDYKGEVFDTLVAARLYYPHSTLKKRDYERRPAHMPERLYGSNSLEAWGYRLKCFKGDYGKQSKAWDVYTPEMLEYCIQDTLVTVRLFELLKRRMNPDGNA